MSVRIAAGPRQVDPLNIESELERLWIAMPHSGQAAPSQNLKMRAVRTNLVAVGSSAAETEAAMQVIGTVIGLNPCRVILLTSEPDIDPPALVAEVAVICQESETCARCVCCDRIQLAARGIMADNLPSLATSLLTPDLPMVVWWPKPSFDRRDVLVLAKQAERMIVDSAGYTPADLRGLAGFVEQLRRMGVAVSDLNWSRLTPFRQLFASLFDSAECRDHLAEIEEVRVEAQPATGLLLAGWLQAQTGKTGPELARERIRLVPSGPTGPSFSSLSMTCSGGGSIFAVNQAGAGTLTGSVTIGAQSRRSEVKSRPEDPGKLLAGEIALSGRDAVYEAALAAAGLL